MFDESFHNDFEIICKFEGQLESLHVLPYGIGFSLYCLYICMQFVSLHLLSVGNIFLVVLRTLHSIGILVTAVCWDLHVFRFFLLLQAGGILVPAVCLNLLCFCFFAHVGVFVFCFCVQSLVVGVRVSAVCWALRCFFFLNICRQLESLYLLSVEISFLEC